jgi:hypothetical protein
MDFSVTAQISGENIDVEIQVPNAETVRVSLNRYQGFAVLETIATASGKLPSDPTTPLHLQEPCFRARDPSFGVGLRGNGDIVVAIRPDPFPPFEFDLPTHAASKLIDDLKRAVMVPPHSGARN